MVSIWRHGRQVLFKLLLPLLAWSVVVVGFSVATIYWGNLTLVQQAEITAEHLFKRNELLQRWSSSHEGIYLAVNDTPPKKSKFTFSPGRDLDTADEKQLTKVRPTHIIHQLNEFGAAEDDVKTNLTSLNPLEPRNVPDLWEEKALRRLSAGEDKVVELFSVHSNKFLRFMKPLFVEKKCLKCHAHQGYSVGDIRGGLSLTVPVEKISDTDGGWVKLLSLVVLWLVGGLSLLWWSLTQYIQERRTGISQERHKRVESNLRFLESYDRQTHLPNNIYLLDQFHSAIKGHGGVETIGLLLIEFPEMSRLQRAYSSGLVAMLMRKAAERIAGCLFQSDLVARVGDYRLAVLLPRIVERTNLQAVATKIARELEEPLSYESEEFQLFPDFGAASFPEDGSGADVIYSRAVSGLEQEGRKFPFQVSFAPESCDLFQRRIQLEKDLRLAIRNRELQVYYQPQMDAFTGRIYGVEALVRWEHAEKGSISPAEFIPWLEEAGLMGRLGEYVIQEASHCIARLSEAGWTDLRLSINLSPRQFRDPELVNQIDKALAKSGFSADQLELEITEGSFIEDFDRTVEVLAELKSLGVSIAIDDFGTGFSSLSYLSRLPVDKLKIDRSFVKTLMQQVEVNHIVEAIISMAAKLDFELVAEGVETVCQVDRLKEMGCRLMQGFYYSKPLNAVALEEFLAQHTRAALQNHGSNDLVSAGT